MDISKAEGIVPSDREISTYLRALAGYPSHAVALSRHRVRNSITWIERDRDGNVISSVERIEVLDIEDLDGRWAN